MPSERVTIDAADGRCEAYVAHPQAEHDVPAVLIYPDAMGVRPAMEEIADRIAGEGYHVLLPDIFYRTPGKVPSAATFFGDAALRAAWQKDVVPTVPPAKVMEDTEAFLEYFGAQKGVRSDAVGITGYCMGGRLAIYAAGHFGDRVAAAAAFHPGGLATDAPDSPHRLAPQITGDLHIGGAMEDRSFDDAQKERLRSALDSAHVRYTLETYPARHGWVPPGTP